MKKTLNILVVGFMALCLGGCASVMRGTTEEIHVRSNPEGAKVTVSNGMVGYTPTVFKLKRKHHYTLTFEKEGYKTAHAGIMSEVAGGGGAAMAGNLLLGGIPGILIDGATGATKSLKPNPVFVELERE